MLGKNNIASVAREAIAAITGVGAIRVIAIAIDTAVRVARTLVNVCVASVALPAGVASASVGSSRVIAITMNTVQIYT